MPVRDPEVIAHFVGGAVRIGAEPIQALSQLQAVIARGRAVALDPRREHGVGDVERARMLRVQAAEIIVVLAAGEQLRQRGAAIIGQRESFRISRSIAAAYLVTSPPCFAR